jgi:hypothetical protein
MRIPETPYANPWSKFFYFGEICCISATPPFAQSSLTLSSTTAIAGRSGVFFSPSLPRALNRQPSAETLNYPALRATSSTPKLEPAC